MKSLGRTELKFLVPPDKVPEIVEFLSSFMELDSHADENGYLIRSLYFDSDELATYYQKRAGELTRFKLRLRTYNTLKGNDGFLEIKWKQGSQTSKERLFGDLDYLKALALGEESAFASNVTEAMPSLPGILSRLKCAKLCSLNTAAFRLCLILATSESLSIVRSNLKFTTTAQSSRISVITDRKSHLARALSRLNFQRRYPVGILRLCHDSICHKLHFPNTQKPLTGSSIQAIVAEYFRVK